MLTIPKYFTAILAIFLLCACGTISKVHTLKDVKEAAKIDFSKYDKIVILDFVNKTNHPPYLNKNKIPITQSFADNIYYKISRSKRFADKKVIKTKSEKFIQSKNLVIIGEITEADDGNDILRGIFGIFGRTRLSAKINFIDGSSKKSIAQIDVKKTSLVYGLFISANQNLDYLIEVSANDVAGKIKNLKEPLTKRLDGKI